MARRRGGEQEMAVHIEWPTYTDADLDEFDKWLQQFKEEVQVKKIGTEELETIHPLNMNEAMVAFGAMRKTFPSMYGGKIPCYAIILKPLETDDYGNTKRYEKPSKYDLFNHKYEALGKLKARRKFGEQKKVEHYEEMAKGVAPAQMEPPPDYDENF